MRLTEGDRVFVHSGPGKGLIGEFVSHNPVAGMSRLKADGSEMITYAHPKQFEVINIDMDRLMELYHMSYHDQEAE